VIVTSSLNVLSLLFTVLAVITAAVVVMAQARRISHEQLTQTAKDWQDIATARTERVNLLQQQQGSLQAQVLDLTARIAAVEKDRDYLVRRNLDLAQELEASKAMIEQLQCLLEENGVRVPRRQEQKERQS
jgi:peptidoglycan hydrolase CwlO-like protein